MGNTTIWGLALALAGGGALAGAVLPGWGLAIGLLALAVGGGIGCWAFRRNLQMLSRAIRALATERQNQTPLPFPFRGLQAAIDELVHRDRQHSLQLASERTRLRVLLDSISAGILMIDAQGKVLLANQALTTFFGLQASPEGRLYPEVCRSAVAHEAISTVLNLGLAETRELELPGGRQLEVQAVPVCRDGKTPGAVVVFYDLTRIRMLERMRKDFVANVSHELRTPLTAIKGCAETLADGALHDPEAAARFMKIIQDHAERLTRLLDDLLGLARLEAEQLEVKREVVPLRGIIDTCLSAVSQAAATKGLALQVEADAATLVYCDRRLLEHALINLVDNAVKYTPEGGRIRVWAGYDPGQELIGQCGDRVEILPRARKPGRQISVVVMDNGIGIPSTDLRRVFERFYRVDKGRSRAMGGTGLGLSIARHVVEVHGEALWVASTLGAGTAFGFTLSPADAAAGGATGREPPREVAN